MADIQLLLQHISLAPNHLWDQMEIIWQSYSHFKTVINESGTVWMLGSFHITLSPPPPPKCSPLHVKPQQGVITKLTWHFEGSPVMRRGLSWAVGALLSWIMTILTLARSCKAHSRTLTVITEHFMLKFFSGVVSMRKCSHVRQKTANYLHPSGLKTHEYFNQVDEHFAHVKWSTWMQFFCEKIHNSSFSPFLKTQNNSGVKNYAANESDQRSKIFHCEAMGCWVLREQRSGGETLLHSIIHTLMHPLQQQQKHYLLECSHSQLVSWYFEPNQSQRTTSGLNTNFTLSY